MKNSHTYPCVPCLSKQSNSFEEVSHWVGIKSKPKLVKVGIGNFAADVSAHTQRQRPSVGPGAAWWRDSLMDCFGPELSELISKQTNQLGVCEPLCGLMPGRFCCKEPFL